jgi:hypothetical protein
VVIDNLHSDAEFVAIDEQTNHDIVHLYGCGEADRFACQAVDAGMGFLLHRLGHSPKTFPENALNQNA